MDNINDLVGDAAKQLMAQADGIQNPRLKESAKRVALTVSAKTRDETITKARNAAFARIPIWAFFLPVTRRQQIVLGRIYSFQCTTNKDGSPAEYRMSLLLKKYEMQSCCLRGDLQKVEIHVRQICRTWIPYWLMPTHSSIQFSNEKVGAVRQFY